MLIRASVASMPYEPRDVTRDGEILAYHLFLEGSLGIVGQRNGDLLIKKKKRKGPTVRAGVVLSPECSHCGGIVDLDHILFGCGCSIVWGAVEIVHGQDFAYQLLVELLGASSFESSLPCASVLSLVWSEFTCVAEEGFKFATVVGVCLCSGCRRTTSSDWECFASVGLCGPSLAATSLGLLKCNTTSLDHGMAVGFGVIIRDSGGRLTTDVSEFGKLAPTIAE
ncbi:Protein Jade-1 [Gossypium australe]|uniref:Protein Jade-1 n=1 Tax=Gossypium australe TaxID=47621 RepID=A0A5B6V8D5_9ROSI|nr:Protein Jade-1 [Gossypium australe]